MTQPHRCMSRRPFIRSYFMPFATVLVISVMVTVAATAQTRTVYSSIPKPLPGNVASEGPEAYAFSELGDGLQLVGPSGGTLGQVTVILSSWACVTGHWYSGDCVTPADATFSQPITINVYAVGAGPSFVVGGLLATITQTFDLPYRPSSDPSKCPADYAGFSRWYDNKEKTCYHGLAVPIIVNFSSQHVSPLPANIVVTVAFNSTHYGYSPIGESAPCFTSSGGCPYDSLNISTDTTDGTFVFIDSPVDINGIFVNYTNAYSACSPSTQPTGSLLLDTGCWAGSHPEIEVQANQNTKAGPKGIGP